MSMADQLTEFSILGWLCQLLQRAAESRFDGSSALRANSPMMTIGDVSILIGSVALTMNAVGAWLDSSRTRIPEFDYGFLL